MTTLTTACVVLRDPEVHIGAVKATVLEASDQFCADVAERFRAIESQHLLAGEPRLTFTVMALRYTCILVIGLPNDDVDLKTAAVDAVTEAFMTARQAETPLERVLTCTYSPQP
jgi:hypothetical protein